VTGTADCSENIIYLSLLLHLENNATKSSSIEGRNRSLFSAKGDSFEGMDFRLSGFFKRERSSPSQRLPRDSEPGLLRGSDCGFVVRLLRWLSCTLKVH